jgi:hypothetical protein
MNDLETAQSVFQEGQVVRADTNCDPAIRAGSDHHVTLLENTTTIEAPVVW